MDQELLIKLSELVEAVEKPDWWTIGITSAITIVNAVIMVWLGINQYKLQKRQTEAQEYEIYRRLYLLLVRTHNEVNDFLGNLHDGTWGSFVLMDKDMLNRKATSINQLQKDLLENYVDYDLKFSQDLFDKEKFRNILATMSAILYHVNLAIEKDEVHMPMGSCHIYPVEGDMEVGKAVAIANRFKNADMILNGIMNFIEQKRRFGSCEDMLKVIKEKCKID
jgi:hypothetical protein